MTLAIIGNGSAAASLAAQIGESHDLIRVPCPDGGSAEARLRAIQGTKWGKVALAVAATGDDERSVVMAAAARRSGVPRATAVVESALLAGQEELAGALGLERLIEPESELGLYLAGQAGGPIAAALRTLAPGRVRVLELSVGAASPAVGISLKDLNLPKGSRVAMIRHGNGGSVVVPNAGTALQAGDRVVLVANKAIAAEASARFEAGSGGAPRALIVGGSDPGRAARLTQRLRELDLAADAVSPQAVAKAASDIAIVVVLEPDLLDAGQLAALAPARVLVIGDAAVGQGQGVVRLTPGQVVADAVLNLLPRPAVARVATISPGELDIYRAEAGESGPWLGKPLCELPGLRGWTVLAIQAARSVHLPHPEDAIGPRDVLLIAGPPDSEKVLRQGLRGA